jgi:hypothetical protein
VKFLYGSRSGYADKFFAYYVLLEGTFASVFINKKLKRSHKIVEITGFLTSVLVEGKISPKIGKKLKVKKFHVLLRWMFSFEG